MPTTAEVTAAAAKLIAASDKAHAIVNGPATGTGSTVTTEAGAIDTYAKRAAAEAALQTAFNTALTSANTALSTFNTNSAAAIATFNTNSAAAITNFNNSVANGIVSVASNAAKLALTSASVQTRTMVKITGEGNRIEMFLGGTISVGANWLVVVNSFQLSVTYEGYGSFVLYKDGTPVTINGGFSTTALGWVREDTDFSAPSLIVSDGYGGQVCSAGITSIWNPAGSLILKRAGITPNIVNNYSAYSPGMLAWENFSTIVKGPKRGSLAVQVGYV